MSTRPFVASPLGPLRVHQFRPVSISRRVRGIVVLLLLLLAFTGTLLVVAPALLRPLFPAATALVGYLIYRKNEAYFLSFLLWIVMLAPLLRRLVDWRTAYQEQSLILLAPLLLMFLPASELRRHLEMSPPLARITALLTLSGILFGAGVGFIKHPNASVVLATATWSAPILLFVFAASIQNTKELSRVLYRTVLWGVLLMSAYGIYQFIAAPPWDAYWLSQISSDIVAPSFGQPQPFGIRVWSTMNAPGPFSVVLSAGLIWLAVYQRMFPMFVCLLGYSALLLTLVRGTWIEMSIALLLLFLGCRSQLSLKMPTSLILLFTVIAFALPRIPDASGIQDRIKTLADLKYDASANERKELYGFVGGLIVESPMGAGLDNTDQIREYPLDSSLLRLFYLLGWPGAALYIAGLAALLASIISRFHSFSKAQAAAAAITLAMATQVFTGDILFHQGGISLWLFGGLWVAYQANLARPPEMQSRGVNVSS